MVMAAPLGRLTSEYEAFSLNPPVAPTLAVRYRVGPRGRRGPGCVLGGSWAGLRAF